MEEKYPCTENIYSPRDEGKENVCVNSFPISIP